jgi:hypothetical protein
MSEKQILIRIASVGGVLAAICASFVAAKLAGVLIFAVLFDAVLRQIEFTRAKAAIPVRDKGDH